MKTKKIVIVHYATPPVIGGVESTIYNHARLLTANGYKVEVIGGRGNKFHPEIEFHQIEEIDSRNSTSQKLGVFLASGSVPAEFADFRDKIAEILRPLLSNTQACIVHNAITLHKNLALTAALRKISDENITKLIAWCHDFAWQDSLYTPDLHSGYPWDLLRTSWSDVQYVVVSEHRRARLAKLLDLPVKQIQVITPGIDVSEFLKLEPLTKNLVTQLDLFDADPLLLLPARITRRKNIEFGIRVTAALRDKKPRTRLIITGPPGPHNPKNITYLEELQTLAVKLGVASNIQFLYQHGDKDLPLQLSDEIVADLYRLSDILFFPSHREGFGIPVLEAGLTRLPIFASDIPPIEESANGLAHRFNPQDDPADVAEKIVNYLEGDQAYQLRHRVIHKFSWQNIIKNQLIPLIDPHNAPIQD